ncbi:MAG: 3-hydroxyacyl-CoA dehydrogenase family protein [Chitinophagaceae bacterium]
MKIAFIGNKVQQAEWEIRPAAQAIDWLSHPAELTDQTTCIDLLFEEKVEHESALVAFQKLGGIVIVNAIAKPCNELPAGFCRLNGWTGFLEKERIELVCENESTRRQLEEVFLKLNRQPEWVKDQIGFITPRVLCSIINEAYLALSEGVSDKNQIDLAMQLGTNYPMGPFAWAEKIGKAHVLNLLEKLSTESSRYKPASLLKEEVYA